MAEIQSLSKRVDSLFLPLAAGRKIQTCVEKQSLLPKFLMLCIPVQSAAPKYKSGWVPYGAQTR
jgi:hypothetical protein